MSNDQCSMESKKKPVITILLIVMLFAGFCLFQDALELRREHEWDFDGEVQYFIINGEVHVWGGGTLRIFHQDKEAEEKLKMRTGEGPGDQLLINKIDFVDGQYLLWDRRLMRMNFFSPAGKLLSTRRFKMPIISAFVGIVNGDYVFKWSDFEGTGSRRVIKEHVSIMAGKEKKPLLEMSGVLLKGEITNYDRPMLLYSLSGNRLYFASNREYKIYTMDLNEKNPSPVLYAVRKIKALEWKQAYADIQWDILKKPPQLPEFHYPDEAPPLFAIAASGDLLAVVTNEQIEKRKAVIDIFKKGKYMGSAVIPILHQQHLVFPIIFAFPPEVYINERWLYTLHYFDDLEVYKIIKWKIIF